MIKINFEKRVAENVSAPQTDGIAIFLCFFMNLLLLFTLIFDIVYIYFIILNFILVGVVFLLPKKIKFKSIDRLYFVQYFLMQYAVLICIIISFILVLNQYNFNIFSFSVILILFTTLTICEFFSLYKYNLTKKYILFFKSCIHDNTFFLGEVENRKNKFCIDLPVTKLDRILLIVLTPLIFLAPLGQGIVSGLSMILAKFINIHDNNDMTLTIMAYLMLVISMIFQKIVTPRFFMFRAAKSISNEYKPSKKYNLEEYGD